MNALFGSQIGRLYKFGGGVAQIQDSDMASGPIVQQQNRGISLCQLVLLCLIL